MRNDFSDALAAQLNKAYKRSAMLPGKFIGVLTIIRSEQIIEFSVSDLSFQVLIALDPNADAVIAHFYFDEKSNKWFCKF